jgi:hypothetical protein
MGYMMADETEILELETEQEGDDQDEALEGHDEVVVEIEGEAAPASSETELVKHLRQVARDQSRKIEELSKANATPVVEVGPKPDFYDDCEGDQDTYDAAYAAWLSRKADADKADAEVQARIGKEQERREAKHIAYREGAKALGVENFEAAQETVIAALSETQQSAIIEVADKPAAVVAALAKYPDRLAEIAKIEDPIALLKAIWNLERNLKVQTRRKAPAPEEVESGNAQLTETVDKHLAKLEAAAERTGNRTEVIRYKRQLKKA